MPMYSQYNAVSLTNDRDDSDTDSSDSELAFLESVDIYRLPELPVNTNVDHIINSIKIDNPINERQKSINDTCSSLQIEFVEIFFSKQYEALSGFIPNDMHVTCTNNSLWTNALSQYHLYVTSEDFIQTLPFLYQYETSLSTIQKYVGSSLVKAFLKDLVHQQAEAVTVSSDEEPPTRKPPLSEPGKAKVRYVGGMCVAKTRHTFSKTVYSNLGNPLKKAKNALTVAKAQVKLLHSFEASKDEIDVTDKTFHEIERRQNITRCLTYINTRCFEFFLLLNERLNKTLTVENLKSEKENIFEFVKHTLKDDDDIHRMWSALCEGIISEEDSRPVFNELLRISRMVGHKQYLKDTKSHFQVIKKKRHREQILDKTGKAKLEISITMRDILNDNSENKSMSHLQLKLNCVSNTIIQNTKAFTKKNLELICNAYNCPYKQSMKKGEIAETLCTEIMASDGMDASVFR